nr:unnamed protein product [Callosobruchus chinensis]
MDTVKTTARPHPGASDAGATIEPPKANSHANSQQNVQTAEVSIQRTSEAAPDARSLHKRQPPEFFRPQEPPPEPPTQRHPVLHQPPRHLQLLLRILRTSSSPSSDNSNNKKSRLTR